MIRMKPKPFEPPAPFKLGQRRNGRIYRVGLCHVYLDIDGATAVAAAMDLALPSETAVADTFRVGDHIPVRVRMVGSTVIEVECTEPEESFWARFARGYCAGDELNGRVHAHRHGDVLVELAPGVIGRIRLRTTFPHNVDTRDFLRVHRPGEPIRVRIASISVSRRHCDLRLTDAETRRWIGPARHRSHWP